MQIMSQPWQLPSWAEVPTDQLFLVSLTHTKEVEVE
jgi:hypothetical protein